MISNRKQSNSDSVHRKAFTAGIAASLPHCLTLMGPAKLLEEKEETIDRETEREWGEVENSVTLRLRLSLNPKLLSDSR